jgi:hypothetical protein
LFRFSKSVTEARAFFTRHTSAFAEYPAVKPMPGRDGSPVWEFATQPYAGYLRQGSALDVA